MARPSKISLMEDEALEAQSAPIPDQDTEINIEATSVFYKNQQSTKTIVVNRGGAGSSKSHSLAQLILFKFFNEQEKRILILRKTLPSLRISTLTLMNQLMNDYGLKDRIVEEKVHLNWYHNGSLIHFQGLDDPEKAKCFHPDTDVLTQEGWKNIVDVRVGEIIATMDPVTREICYKPVSSTFVYDYEGSMISPDRSSGLSFCVTPEHKMLVSDGSQLKQVEAQYLKPTDFLFVIENVSKTCGNLQRNPYKGKVYCLEVLPYHTMLTRYNGKVLWTGNSSEWNIIWCEEATEFTWEDYSTIKLRLRAKSKDGVPNQIFLSFNPIDEMHWIKEKLVDDKTQDVEEIVSNYKDNPFLPKEYIKDLEDLQLQDMSFYNVYTLGNWGKLENIIYKNWTTCDWMPDYSAVDKVFYGLDFGYNDPSALIECRVKGKDVWERELLYHTKMTNSDLINKLYSLIPDDKRQKYIIYADSAEPDRIKEIKDAGFRIKPAIKLVSNGIDIVKRFNVHIMSDSLNLIKEKRAYSWKKDRNGNVTDEPIGIWDHLMSAERYALHTGTKGAGIVRVRFL